VIAKGDRSVDVTFEEEYLTQPIVGATITLDRDPRLDKEADPEKIEKILASQEKRIDELFKDQPQYIVVNKSGKGFTIILKENASEDISFSWIAFAVKDAKTFFSLKGGQDLSPAAPAPEQAAEPQPADVSSSPEDQMPPPDSAVADLPAEDSSVQAPAEEASAPEISPEPPAEPETVQPQPAAESATGDSL
jgi:hypothetical protein